MRVEKWRNMRKDYSEKQYNEIYKKILKLYKRNELKKKKSENIESDEELDEEDYEMLEDNKYKEIPTYYKFGPSILLILDLANVLLGFIVCFSFSCFSLSCFSFSFFLFSCFSIFFI